MHGDVRGGQDNRSFDHLQCLKFSISGLSLFARTSEYSRAVTGIADHTGSPCRIQGESL